MRFHLPQTVVSQLTRIRRQRLLAAPGEILVREGERVDPVQVIGHAYVPGGISVVDVAQRLGVRAGDVQRYLKVKSGQEVKQGEVLAARGRLARRTCRSPVDGRVLGSTRGQLVIEALPLETEVRAGYYGTVVRVLSNRGVVIQVSGALIQGAWGNGMEGFGVLRTLVETRDGTLQAPAIDASCRGVILVGGSCLDAEALEQAVELHVRGIIVGGVPPELVKEANNLPFPVIATEGVGVIPMSSPIFQLLSTHNGREAVVDGRFQTRRETLRPEIIIPLPAEAGTDRLKLRETPLQSGDRVRAVRGPHSGLSGTVLDLPTARVQPSTSMRLLTVRVQPEDGGEPILIPLSNLEVPR
jgi:hypothetical protein